MARTLAVTENITLDGVIDASGDWFAPAADDDQSDLNATLREQAAQADSVLLGRVTFESFRSYWKDKTDDDSGVAEYLNRVEKYVVSTTIGDPDWVGTTVLAGDLERHVRELKSAAGDDIVATGSIRLVHELVRLGLVDEYRLFVYPVVVGSGARLFEEGLGPPELELIETRAFRSSVVLLRYRAS